MARSIGTTPMAVLAGSAMIAVAVFFGLRARPVVVAPLATSGAALPSSEGSSTPPAAPPSVSTPSATAITGLPPTAGAPPTAVSVDADALAALEAERATLVESCWKPIMGGQAKPQPATYRVDVSFDQTGHEVAKGLSPAAGVSDELTHCLYVHGPRLVIPSRGVRTRALVTFTLP